MLETWVFITDVVDREGTLIALGTRIKFHTSHGTTEGTPRRGRSVEHWPRCYLLPYTGAASIWIPALSSNMAGRLTASRVRVGINQICDRFCDGLICFDFSKTFSGWQRDLKQHNRES